MWKPTPYPLSMSSNPATFNDKPCGTPERFGGSMLTSPSTHLEGASCSPPCHPLGRPRPTISSFFKPSYFKSGTVPSNLDRPFACLPLKREHHETLVPPAKSFAQNDTRPHQPSHARQGPDQRTSTLSGVDPSNGVTRDLGGAKCQPSLMTVAMNQKVTLRHATE